jgi:hypothetical protein
VLRRCITFIQLRLLSIFTILVLKRQCHKKVWQKSILGNALNLKFEQLTCLKFFHSCVLKLQFLKLTFNLSKNVLTCGPELRLNLIPVAGLILLIETWCAYNILHGRLLSEMTVVKCTLICGPDPIHHNWMNPARSKNLSE